MKDLLAIGSRDKRQTTDSALLVPMVLNKQEQANLGFDATGRAAEAGEPCHMVVRKTVGRTDYK